MSSDRNEAEAENDRKDREAIVPRSDAQLKKGDKALIGNSACSALICAKSGGHKAPDSSRHACRARLAGKRRWAVGVIRILRTNAR